MSKCGFKGVGKGEWTVALVKELLPPVNVKLGSNLAEGKVMGRKERFATVTCMTFAGEIANTYAWETIAWALNNDKPLSV